MATILVLALGNPLMSDDGLGVQALAQLQKNVAWPDTVAFLDGDVLGLGLLPYIENVDKLLVLDAVHTGEAPGTLVRLENDDIPAVVRQKMSVHQVGFQEALAMGKLLGTLPDRIVLWGIVPEQMQLGMTLSECVASQVPALCEAVLAELHTWINKRELRVSSAAVV